MVHSPSRCLVASLLAIALLISALPRVSQAQEATAVAAAEVVADGIANPRGFTWGADGAMFLAVSGTGGDTPGPEGSPFSGGNTAAVATVRDGRVTTLAEGLPSSVWRDIGWVWGVTDVAILGDHLYALNGGGNLVHGNPDAPSGIYRIDANGEATLIADLGAWVDAHPVANIPPEGAPNGGSWFAMVPVGDALWVTDAVNGQILAVTPAGEVTRIADLSEGHPVPTGLAADPEGGAWVGYLTLPPYTAGSARISHVAPDGTVENVWAGLQAVTGIALGPDGVLYAAEMATEMTDEGLFFTHGTGRIVRQTGPASAEEVASGLDLPVAIRFGPDDALYIAAPAFGADNNGQLLRIAVPTAAPAGGSVEATPVS
jgi:hypothetical protein